MKKLLVSLLLLAVSGWVYAADYTPKGWLTDAEAAQKQAQEQSRPIMVLISGPEWCPPCRQLEKTVISKAAFLEFVQQNAVGLFVHVPHSGLSAETRKLLHKLTFFRGVVPSYAVTDADFNVLATPKGRTIDDFKTAIKEAAEKLKK